jgi:CHAT domain-containing protein
LIAPFAQQLQQTATQTMVFIQDGILRSIPMAALHNGERFLIAEYAIATTPSLTLTPTTLDKTKKFQALAVGVTKSSTLADGSQFPPLPNVAQEIGLVQTQLSNTKTLLDGEFNPKSLQQELTNNQYSILHIATHGEFSHEPSDTFLVTGDETKITIQDLDNILRNNASVELHL